MMGKKKVLVVDDDAQVADTIKIYLERTDKYELRILSEAKGILDQVHAFKPDVILLDLLMPGIGGLEAVKMLDDDSLGINIPIIVLSGLDDEADKIKAYKLGVVDYLVKSIHPKELLASIEKALQFKSPE